MSEEEAQVFRGGRSIETAVSEHAARKKKKPVTGPKVAAVSLQDVVMDHPLVMQYVMVRVHR